MLRLDKESRTYKSIKNSTVALSVFVINLLLQFISRRVFIDCLGTEVLGLNTTAISLLQFLNLAELGVGAAIMSSLYSPLSNNDFIVVSEIVSVQGWLYRNIAFFIMGGSAILMLFFPLIFAKMELPLWYAYATFSVLLFSSLLSYFVNYKQIVLSADQKEYKIQYSFRVVLLIKLIAQIIAVMTFKNGYIWWLFLEFLFAIFSSIALNITVRRTYPQLKTSVKEGRELSKKYPIITTRIKQFFFHKIAGFALTQSSPLVIYAYTTLTTVAIYGNYMIVVNGALSLLNAIFNGMAASVGNLVAEGKKERLLKVFNELLTSRFFIVGSCAFIIFELADGLITHWLGAELLLSHTTLFLIVTLFFLNTVRSVVDSFINAYGLFRDIWAPIVEATLNLSLSVLLGFFYGINGVLSGVLISLLVIVYTWKPYFLFHYALHTSVMSYVKIFVKLLFIMSIAMALSHLVIDALPLNSVGSLLHFGILVIAAPLIFIVVYFSMLWFFEKSMRTFIYRFISK